MMPDPRVSILLPVRNAESTLPSCIASIEAQTVRDWECLAIDDRSTDGSRGLLDAWAARDSRVRVGATAGQGGIVAALEAARGGARAPFLARHDADDRSHPLRLERQLGELDANPGIAVVGCRTESQGGQTDGMRRYLEWLRNCTDSETCAREIWVECPIVHPTAVMRAEVIARVGGYRDMGWPEDYDLWLRVHLDGRAVMNIQESLYIWSDSPDRLSRVDPRYSPDAFLRCRLRHLRRWLAVHASGRPLIVWGAGRDGKRLVRAWEEETRTIAPPAESVVAFIDIDPRKLGRSRRGRPVYSLAEARSTFPGAFFLVAVGVPGARELIRDELAKSGLREVSDFVCLH
jgi:glycosyltransferase involved in cell wall biosynthesis